MIRKEKAELPLGAGQLRRLLLPLLPQTRDLRLHLSLLLLRLLEEKHDLLNLPEQPPPLALAQAAACSQAAAAPLTQAAAPSLKPPLARRSARSSRGRSLKPLRRSFAA